MPIPFTAPEGKVLQASHLHAPSSGSTGDILSFFHSQREQPGGSTLGAGCAAFALIMKNPLLL